MYIVKKANFNKTEIELKPELNILLTLNRTMCFGQQRIQANTNDLLNNFSLYILQDCTGTYISWITTRADIHLIFSGK